MVALFEVAAFVVEAVEVMTNSMSGARAVVLVEGATIGVRAVEIPEGVRICGCGTLDSKPGGERGLSRLFGFIKG
jgi:hypothetical protein